MKRDTVARFFSAAAALHSFGWAAVPKTGSMLHAIVDLRYQTRPLKCACAPQRTTAQCLSGAVDCPAQSGSPCTMNHRRWPNWFRKPS